MKSVTIIVSSLLTAATSFEASSSFVVQSNPSLIQTQKHRQALVLMRGGSDVPTASTTELNISSDSSETSAPEPTIDSPPPVVAEVASSPAVTKGVGPNAKTPPGFLRSTFPTFPWHTLPNLLTYARCIAIPIFIIQFCASKGASKNAISSAIFSIASITDYLDGYLARRWDITSSFGAFLDPVADKLMVSTALILLAGKYGAVVSIPTSIIIAREIAVSALREWMASLGKRDSVKVGMQGKIKTFATMVSLAIILAVPDGWDVSKLAGVTNLSSLVSALKSDWLMSLGMGLLYLSSVVTITSGSVYFKAAYPVLMDNK